jgi:hypothetical protein
VAPTWAARSARSRVSGPRPSCASSAARHPAQAEPDRGALVAEQPAVAVAPAHDPAPGEGCGRRARARQQQQAVGLGRARGECDLEISDDPRDAGQPQRAPCRLRRDAHGRPPRRTPAGDTEHAGPHPGRVRAAEGGAQRRGESILRLPAAGTDVRAGRLAPAQQLRRRGHHEAPGRGRAGVHTDDERRLHGRQPTVPLCPMSFVDENTFMKETF